MTKMTKNTKIIIAVIAALIPIVIILTILHQREMAEVFNRHIDGTFTVVAGEQMHSISASDIVAMNPTEITAVYRGEPRTFTGIPIASVIDYIGADPANISSVVFVSLDGFFSAIAAAEALDSENAFLVFEEDEKPLGHMDDGGEGPFRLVLVNDPFPNRWARYVMEIRLQ
jgi:hypothetical protein